MLEGCSEHTIQDVLGDLTRGEPIFSYNYETDGVVKRHTHIITGLDAINAILYTAFLLSVPSDGIDFASLFRIGEDLLNRVHFEGVSIGFVNGETFAHASKMIKVARNGRWPLKNYLESPVLNDYLYLEFGWKPVSLTKDTVSFFNNEVPRFDKKEGLPEQFKFYSGQGAYVATNDWKVFVPHVSLRRSRYPYFVHGAMPVDGYPSLACAKQLFYDSTRKQLLGKLEAFLPSEGGTTILYENGIRAHLKKMISVNLID